MAPRPLLLFSAVAVWSGYCLEVFAGKVLTGADMRAMGMGELAGIADGDMSPESVAALERHGVADPALKRMHASKGKQGVDGGDFTPHGGGTQAMSMAHLSEEESVGSAVPDSMRCDACHAISHQLAEALAHASGTRNTALPEAKVIERLEEVCEGKLHPKALGTGDNYRVVEQDWGEYCIKDIDGENRMAGPGCPLEDQSGYAQFGMMKTRLTKKCYELLGEHDEAQVYEWYRELADSDGTSVHAYLKEMMCAADCKPKKKKKKTMKKPEKAESGGSKKQKGKKHRNEQHKAEKVLKVPAAQKRPAKEGSGGAEVGRLRAELERIRAARAELVEQEDVVLEQLSKLMLRMPEVEAEQL